MSLASRKLLHGVPRLHFYEGDTECPRDLCLPAVMTAVVTYLDDQTLRCRCAQTITPACKVACAYAFFIGVSGVASHFAWKPGWDHESFDVRFLARDPLEPVARCIHAAGLSFEALGPSHGHAERTCAAAISSSIDDGMPVIAIGPLFGPPEAMLITGYDDDGEILIGWSFFQNISTFSHGLTYEPTGEFQKRHWFAASDQLFLILRRGPDRPSLSHSYREGLKWMLNVGRNPSMHGDRASGLAAYDAWADHLQQNDWPADQQFHRHEVHNTAVGYVAEARWYGAKFLMQAAEPNLTGNRASAHLLTAASKFAAQHSLMWDLWDLAGGNGNPDAHKRFADPHVRRHMTPIVNLARKLHSDALDQIDQALLTLSA